LNFKGHLHVSRDITRERKDDTERGEERRGEGKMSDEEYGKIVKDLA
jgi:hypothetical protein